MKPIYLAALLLAGCNTAPTKVEVQEVKVPIAIPCKTEVPQAPQYCFNGITANNTIFEKTRCLLSDRELSLGYQTELLAALLSCK